MTVDSHNIIPQNKSDLNSRSGAHIHDADGKVPRMTYQRERSSCQRSATPLW